MTSNPDEKRPKPPKEPQTPKQTPSQQFLETFLQKRNISRFVSPLGQSPPEIQFDDSILDSPLIKEALVKARFDGKNGSPIRATGKGEDGLANQPDSPSMEAGTPLPAQTKACVWREKVTGRLADLFVRPDDTDYPSMKIHHEMGTDNHLLYNPEIDGLAQRGHVLPAVSAVAAGAARTDARTDAANPLSGHCLSNVGKKYVYSSTSDQERNYHFALKKDASLPEKIQRQDIPPVPRLFRHQKPPLFGTIIKPTTSQDHLLDVYANREKITTAQQPPPLPPRPTFLDLIIPSLGPLIERYLTCVQEKQVKLKAMDELKPVSSAIENSRSRTPSPLHGHAKEKPPEKEPKKEKNPPGAGGEEKTKKGKATPDGKNKKKKSPPTSPVQPVVVSPPKVAVTAPQPKPPQPLVFCYPAARLLLRPEAPLCLGPATCVENYLAKEDGVRKMRFKFADAEQLLGAPPGQFVLLNISTEKGQLIWPVFPATPCDNQGFFDVIWQSDNEQQKGFSSALSRLSVNDPVTVQGPFGGLVYNGDGWFTHVLSFSPEKITKQYRHVVMIGMALGVLPFASILDQAVRERHLKTAFTLLQIGLEKRDFWMPGELDRLASSSSGVFTWKKLLLDMGINGQIRENVEKIVVECFPVGSDGTLIVIFAPLGLVNSFVIPALENTGFLDRKCRFVFGEVPQDESFQCDEMLLKSILWEGRANTEKH